MRTLSLDTESELAELRSARSQRQSAADLAVGEGPENRPDGDLDGELSSSSGEDDGLIASCHGLNRPESIDSLQNGEDALGAPLPLRPRRDAPKRGQRSRGWGVAGIVGVMMLAVVAISYTPWVGPSRAGPHLGRERAPTQEFVTAPGSTPAERVGHERSDDGAAPRSLLESPEFCELLVQQVHPISNRSRDWLRVGVGTFAKGFSALVDKHLKPEHRQALRDTRLTQDQWNDIGTMISAVRDPRVANLGREALLVVRNDTDSHSDPESMHVRLKDFVEQKLAEISILQDKHVPDSVRRMAEAWLLRRFRSRNGGSGGQGSAGPGPQLWRGMLAPEVLERLRENRTVHTRADEVEMGFPAADLERRLLEEQHSEFYDDARRLQASTAAFFEDQHMGRMLQAIEIGVTVQEDAWANPVLNGLTFGLGLASNLMLIGFEVCLHLEFFLPGFYMPWWAWLLLIGPTEGLGITSCIFGLSIFCKMMLGAVGVHVIEGTMGLIYFAR